jgi:hypothetical protein
MSRGSATRLLGVGATAFLIAAAGAFGVVRPAGAFMEAEFNLRATLTGAAVPGGGDPDGSGTAGVFIRPVTGGVVVTLTVNGITEPATAAHIHSGAAGTTGPILFTLQAPHADGVEAGPSSFAANPTLTQDMVAHPGNYYIDVHNADFPGGALRGQLEVGRNFVSTWAVGSSEVPGPGDPDGAGRVVASIDVIAGQLCSTFDLTGIGPQTSANIRQGAPGHVGPVILALPPPAPAGAPDNCTTGVDPAILQAIQSNPGAYYAEVATAEFPNGAVRGQFQAGNDAAAPPATCQASGLCDGTLPPGTYTYSGLGTALTFTTSREFIALVSSFTDPGRAPVHLLDLNEPNGFGVFTIFKFGGVIHPNPCGAAPTAQIGTSPDDLMAWLSSQSSIRTSTPVHVHYGGAPGLQVDIVGRGAAACPRYAYLWQVYPDREEYIQTGSAARVVAQDVAGQTIVTLLQDISPSDIILASTSGPTFVAQTQPVLNTYRWHLSSTLPNTATSAATLVSDRWPLGSVGLGALTMAMILAVWAIRLRKKARDV